MTIALEFQEFVVVVVAPVAYILLDVLLALSLITAGVMPLLELGRILRKAWQDRRM